MTYYIHHQNSLTIYYTYLYTYLYIIYIFFGLESTDGRGDDGSLEYLGWLFFSVVSFFFLGYFLYHSSRSGNIKRIVYYYLVFMLGGMGCDG